MRKKAAAKTKAKAAKKSTAKSTKKSATKKATKKAAKKAAKKSAAKKGTAKKSAAKKGTAKKGAAKKSTSRKSTAKRKPTTTTKPTATTKSTATATRDTSALTLHLVGLGLMVARDGQPIQVLLPNHHSHGGGHIEEHQLWIAYREDQTTNGPAPTDKEWPSNAWPNDSRLRARRITARASIDFRGLVETGTVKLPAGLVDIATLTHGKRASSALLRPDTVADTSVTGRVTLPGGSGRVGRRGGRWRADGVLDLFPLFPDAIWNMTLADGGDRLTLEVVDLGSRRPLTRLPELSTRNGPIELWVFHVPAAEANGHGSMRKPRPGDPAMHFEAYYFMPDLDSGRKPIPRFVDDQPVAAGQEAEATAGPAPGAGFAPRGINPFTCMLGGDDGEP